MTALLNVFDDLLNEVTNMQKNRKANVMTLLSCYGFLMASTVHYLLISASESSPDFITVLITVL